jgi:hypothetical protein
MRSPRNRPVPEHNGHFITEKSETKMDFLILIKNGCENLTATVSPSIDALGLHMVIALATIMLVWYGVQEALASAQGGPGFNLAKFISFFVLITFAYCFVKFYDSSIPGIGYSLNRIHQRRDKSACRLHRQRLEPSSPGHNPHGARKARKPGTFIYRAVQAHLHLHSADSVEHSHRTHRGDHCIRRRRGHRRGSARAGLYSLVSL